MTPDSLRLLKARLKKFWFLSPERLWFASITLRRRGHWVLAFWIKQLNSLLYHNSLAPGASVSRDIFLGHNSMGIVIGSKVVIGRRVNIWHNVTITARPAPGSPAQIVIEDDVKIGANAVLITPRGGSIHIGRGVRIGAGAVVTKDVPERATVVGPPSRVMLREPAAGESTESDDGSTQTDGLTDMTSAPEPEELTEKRP